MRTAYPRRLLSVALVFALVLVGTAAAFGQMAEGPASKPADCASQEKGAAAQGCDTQAGEQKPAGEESATGHAAPPQQAGSGPSPSQAAEPKPTAAEEQAELAKKLANPIASLISVPFQSNFDFGMGPNENGFRFTMNLQPVVPISINKDWNLISRTILPTIHQGEVIPGTSQTGLGDVVQSFFISPAKPKRFIWGVGPVLLVPTATNEFLGTQKFGIGPTLLVLKQKKGWTVGMLTNHIWSVAGKSSRAAVSSTFLQPFVSYTTKKAWTFTINTESSYDWTGEQWSVPVHVQVSKLVRFGKQPVSLGGSLRCWATSPSGGAQGCGFRLVTTLLFPKK